MTLTMTLTLILLTTLTSLAVLLAVVAPPYLTPLGRKSLGITIIVDEAGTEKAQALANLLHRTGFSHVGVTRSPPQSRCPRASNTRLPFFGNLTLQKSRV